MAPISKTPLPKVLQTPSTRSECSYVSSYCGTEDSSPDIIQQIQGNSRIDGGTGTKILPSDGIYTSPNGMLGPLDSHNNSIMENSGPNLGMEMDTVKLSLSNGNDKEALSTSFDELAVRHERETASQSSMEVDDDDVYVDENEENGAVELNAVIRTEWIGTSQFFINQGVAMQTNVSVF